MSNIRQRKTWGQPTAGFTPVRASAHPAYPDEGITHPAGYPDPEADAFETGDPSSWAEDPHPGPYRTSPAPAMPLGDDGSYVHPATQPGAPGKNASKRISAAELEHYTQKAEKCLQIAAALLPVAAEDKVLTPIINAQATDLLHLPNAVIAATLRRIEACTADPAVLERKLILAGELPPRRAQMEEEEEEEVEETPKEAYLRRRAQAEEAKKEEEETKKEARLRRRAQAEKEMKEEEEKMEPPKDAKKAAAYFRRLAEEAEAEAKAEEEEEEAKKSASRRSGSGRIAQLEATIAQLQAQMAGLTGGGVNAQEDEELMLAQMLAEEEAPAVASGDEDEALLAQMLAEAPATAQECAQEEVVAQDDGALANYLEDTDLDVDFLGDPMDDPMGYMESDMDPMSMMDEGEASMLANLFASDKYGSEEESEEEEKPKTAASRTASVKQRPQPKRASAGARVLGGQVHLAKNERDVLGNLWASAPDVSRVFNS